MLPRYIYWDDVLTPEECGQIIDAGTSKMSRANTDNNEPGGYRTGSVGWFVKGQHPDLDPLFGRVIQAFAAGVREGFRGATIGQIEPIQYTHYEPGDHFNWHYDAFDRTDKPLRQFSASMELCDPKTYEGGGLEFQAIDPPIPERKIGRLIVFPSLLLHRARRVTSGTRSSLVLWGHA